MAVTPKTEDRAYLLHAVPYSETSLVVDLFTRDHGRIAAIAKGAKRRGSTLRAALMQFQPLNVTYTGRNELRLLTSAEWQGGQPAPQGRALLLGFYMNELLVRLLAREDPHPHLYDGYRLALIELAQADDSEDDVLRRFEWLLLRESGYAPDLEYDAADRPITPGQAYHWRPSGGFVLAEPGADAAIDGETLSDIVQGQFVSAASRMQAKYLTRAILAHHLEGVPLNTRQILLDLQKL